MYEALVYKHKCHEVVEEILARHNHSSAFTVRHNSLPVAEEEPPLQPRILRDTPEVQLTSGPTAAAIPLAGMIEQERVHG